MLSDDSCRVVLEALLVIVRGVVVTGEAGECCMPREIGARAKHGHGL